MNTLQIVLAVGGVLAVTGVMAALLIVMAIWIARWSAKGSAEVEVNWQALAQSLSLAAQPNPNQPPTLTGTYRGRPLRVIGHYGRRNSSGYTRVSFQTDLQADVYLRKSRGPTAGVEHIPSGDAELDRRFAFQSRPPDLAARAAADPALGPILLPLLGS